MNKFFLQATVVLLLFLFVADYCSAECVDMPTLVNYITQWKAGSISMTILVTKISAWKAGTSCTPIPTCSAFLNSVWTPAGGILANGAWDESSYPQYLSVVQMTDGSYALKTQGEYNVHRYNRFVLEKIANDFNGQDQASWGGKMFVNPKDIVSVTGIAIAGAYNYSYSGWLRDFAILLIKNGSAGAMVCFNAYWHADPALCITGQGFPISAQKNSWPDRWIKIEWFFTKSYSLYARVDGSAWKRIPTEVAGNWACSQTQPCTTAGYFCVNGFCRTKFNRFATGWVSSYDGGNIYIKDVELYNEECVPSELN